MITVRISFEKKNEASYISLLDMQRVMQRVLKWKTALNAIMPAGIVVTKVAPVEMKADLIAYACYEIRYPAARKAALEAYNALESVPVEKKSKRKVKTVELKEFVPSLDLTEEGEQVRFSICLPASQELAHPFPDGRKDAVRLRRMSFGQNRKFLGLFWTNRLHLRAICAILLRR